MKNGISRGKKGEKEAAPFSLIFPGPERWEFWQGASPESLAPSGSADQPRDLPMPGGVILCFPGSVFCSLPLWNPVTEGVSARDQAALNLEERGLLGSDPESAVWAADSIRRQSLRAGEGERELSASAVLHTQIPPDLILEGIRHHEIPGRLLRPPGEGPGAVLRRELGRWVLDLYDRGKWLHSQTLLARELDDEAAREIRLLLAQMEQEQVCQGWRELVVRGAVSPDAAELMGQRTGLRLVRGEETRPFLLPSLPWDLLPREVADQRQAKQKQKRFRTLVAWALAVDLALWSLATLFVLVPGIQLWRLEQALSPLRPEYRRLAKTKLIWEELRSLTNPSGTALEVLHQVTQPLLGENPKLDIKLTVFSFGPDELQVEGVTGQNEQVIRDYLATVSANAALQGLYTWPSKAVVEPKGKRSGFTLTAPSTAPRPEKTENGNVR